MSSLDEYFNALLVEARDRLNREIYDPCEGVTPGELVLTDMQEEGLCTAEEARYMRPCLDGRWFK